MTLPQRALTTIERAYQLAREGPCTTIEEIRKQLDREQYTSVGSHLTGPTIRKQLRALCRERLAAAAETAEG